MIDGTRQRLALQLCMYVHRRKYVITHLFVNRFNKISYVLFASHSRPMFSYTHLSPDMPPFCIV